MASRNHEEDIVGRVDQYVHGLLSRGNKTYVERRVRESAVWAAAHEEALRRRELLESVPAAEADEDLVLSTMRRVRSEGPRREKRAASMKWVAVTAVAAVIALFISVNLYYETLRPTPFNLELLGQRELEAGSTASLRVRLSRATSGEGVEGAGVAFALRDRESGRSIQLAAFETDGAGTGSPRLVLPDWNPGEYELSVRARTASGTEEITQTIKLRREWRLLLSTDKPAYQPGQTLRMRTFALRTASGRPVGGEKATFEVADAKGNLIFRESTVTSEFGIAHADCLLADMLNEGSYAVRCRVGETESTRSIRVERYVLPKFRVDLDLDKPFFSPGDMVRVRVNAQYFFGRPVAGASARFEIESDGLGNDLPRGPLEIQLDEEGRGELEFRLPDRLFGEGEDAGDRAFWLRASVRDTAGQEVRRVMRRIVTQHPLRIAVVPEAGELVAGIANEVFVFVTSADGSPVDARVAVQGLRKDLQTGSLGVASFTVTPEGDEIELGLRATDGVGRSVSDSVVLGTSRGTGAFVLRTDAASYDAGQAVRLSVLGTGSEAVFVDLIKDDQTIHTEMIPVADGRGELEFDLPLDATGVLKIVAYRFDDSGWPMRRVRSIVVRPASDLRVAVDGLSKPHRPGDVASLAITMTDANGVAVPGAVSLAIVDEAALNALSGDVRLDAQFRGLEHELLEPVYAVYPWDPFSEVAGEAGTTLERGVGALTSRGAESGREDRLRQLAEEGYIWEEALDLLDEPGRLDRAIDVFGDAVSPELLELLAGNSGEFSLRQASYPDKERDVAQRQRAWRKARAGILGTAGVLGGLALVVVLLTVSCRAAGCSTSVLEVLVVIVIIALLIGILLPSLGKARRSAQNVSDASTLRSLEQALALAPPAPAGTDDRPMSGQSVRIREWFPETLLWRPELVTNKQGRAVVEVRLADSITNWKVTGGAITTDGRLGTMDTDLVVFQPFFVDINSPVSLIRGDTIDLPVVVYNYLDQAQTVKLRIVEADWFELLGERERQLTLSPREIASTSFRIRAKALGDGVFEVHATGSRDDGASVADAIRREISVDPEGQPIDRVHNGVLRNPARIDIAFPSKASEGSECVLLKLYPSSFSQILEGLDGIFARPYGCFEQTSSTTYPNLLALDYLRRTGVSAPEIEAKALQYIHLGYQRLLSFEVEGGGFDWFGSPPANRTLTAYGLMQFEDMARVRDVDPRLVERTRAWLLEQQRADGSWDHEQHEMHDGPASRNPREARLVTTAYITWAIFRGVGGSTEEAARAADFIARSPAREIDDPYVLAMIALALHAADRDATAEPYLDRLLALRKRESGQLTSWSRMSGTRTMFYGAGRSADIEATSLVVLALLEAGCDPSVTRAALRWLADQRDASGTWGTTQATVLALKAMVTAADRPVGSGQRRVIEVGRVDGERRRVEIEAGQSHVMQLIDLSDWFGDGTSASLSLADLTGSATAYQVVLRHHEILDQGTTPPAGALLIDLEYDTAELRVGERVTASAKVSNLTQQTLPMVMLDLPVPAGFRPNIDDFERMLSAGSIARFEINPRAIIVYLRKLEPEHEFELRYRMSAVLPADVEVRGASVSEYYSPEVRAVGASRRFRVVAP